MIIALRYGYSLFYFNEVLPLAEWRKYGRHQEMTKYGKGWDDKFLATKLDLISNFAFKIFRILQLKF